MKSKWKVTSNSINGETMYAVFRLLDTSKTDHSGNREYAGGYTTNKQAALDVAAELNKNTEEIK